MSLRNAFAILLFTLILTATSIQSATFYVSPTGDDSWSGSLAGPNENDSDGPFLTLERAVGRVKEIQREAGNQIKTVVKIRGGRYERTEPIILSGVGVGNSDAGTLIEAYPGEEVVFSGGTSVDSWKKTEEAETLERLPEEARGQVFESDLFAQGITDYGVLKERGFGRSVHPAAMELFFDNEPMTLARWPNEGFVHIADVTGSATGGKFHYEGDRPERWRKANDIWLHGLWTWDWADSYTRVQSIDEASKEFTTYPPHGVYGYKKNRRYYALNLLEELDRPGEYYLDRVAGKLYFWPPSELEKGKAVVSIARQLLKLEDCAGVRVRGITFEATRGHGVEFRGGHNNQIDSCTIRNIGNTGAIVSGGTRNKVVRSEVYNCGDGGISLTGGDRKTLTPGHNEVTDCHIHHYSRWSKTYRPAVSIGGVSNRVAHNHIHDAPHNAIQLGGNQHIIEYNEVHHVCQETADVGAFYMGRDWTQRENVIRYNFFHHLGGFEGRDDAFSEAIAIYLDDWSSGTEIIGNVVYKGGFGVLIGGGRDNLVKNNIFVDCNPSVHVDSRGLGWAKYYFNGENNTLIQRLDAMDYKNPPYSERYPELLTLYDDDPAVAKYNKILNNILVGEGKDYDLANGLDETVVEMKDNWTEGDPGFINMEEMNFNLKEDSPVFEMGFEKIPFDEIGPRGRR